MKPMGLEIVTAACLLLVGACEKDVYVGDTVDSGASSGLLCSSANPCPEGQFCFNGICAVGCNSNGDCATDQYCDTEFDRLCHNRAVASCPETACASNQTCVSGLCSATEASGAACTPSPDGVDGCDRYSVCIEREEEQYECHAFPACSEHGTCPVGSVGALCNNGILPGKAHICLTGLCDGVDNCPSAWNCVRGNPADVVGFCSNGSLGSPCSSESECVDQLTCYTPFPGYVGFCT